MIEYTYTLYKNKLLFILLLLLLLLLMIIPDSLLKTTFALRLEDRRVRGFPKSINASVKKNIMIHSAGGLRYRFMGAYCDIRYYRDIITPLTPV